MALQSKTDGPNAEYAAATAPEAKGEGGLNGLLVSGIIELSQSLDAGH